MKRLFTSFLAAVLVLTAAVVGAAADELDAGFQKPPDSARPWVYWFIMDGNLSREGITADLEAMERAGLGGVILMEVDMGIPRGPVKFMSVEWQELFRHAVREAQRLGLQMTLNAGPGWTGSGGPWVKPEQSMQHVVGAETNLIGPLHFNSALPRPVPRKPFFGEGGLPPDQERARKDFYEDVAVLAYPTPSGTAGIAELDEKAFYLRAPYSSQPGVKPFLPAPSHYASIPAVQCVETNQVRELTHLLAADGRLSWDVPAGSWTILRLGRTTTGQNTRPAPLPGLGLESDKFDPAALDSHFAAFIGTLLRGLNPVQTNGSGWTMLHIDSWEMSSQNWTPKFRQEFRARRGYDLLLYLPVLTGRIVGSTEISERFLWDLRQTAQELIVQNHALRLKELGRMHGLGLSIEPYDMNPCADLTLGGVADVPMCEFWSKGYGFNTDFTCFEAVSIAHTLGKPIVASESFTADGEGWVQHPGSMKAQGDWALCTGINRVVFHRFQHQPRLDRWPGLTMGSIGVHWERTQTWWDFVPAYHQYLARCQFLLRQGMPVADICYLAPEGAPHVFRAPKSATRGNPPDRLGYSFDGCAPEVLRDKATVKDGRLVFPGGMSYAVLVLPEFDTMTPGLLRKIKQLVDDGATVIGAPPRKSPSLSSFPGCDDEVRALASQLWGEGVSEQERGVGKGRLYYSAPPQTIRDSNSDIYPEYAATVALLRKRGVPPDLESDVPVRYTHRQITEGHIYFVANPADQKVKTSVRLRVSGRHAEIWDPVTGEKFGVVIERAAQGGGSVVPLQFEPHQSFFLLLRSEPSTSSQASAFPELRSLTEVSGPWEVSFQTGRGAPNRLTFPTLVDWSIHPDAGVRHFSGIASYTTEFIYDLTSPGMNQNPRLFLDLGKVQVMARVRLNDHDLGVVWTAPFRVDVTTLIRQGTNTLEIQVANLWCNRLIADAALPPDKRVTWTTWNPFRPESPLVTSGLLGPIRLMTEQRSSTLN